MTPIEVTVRIDRQIIPDGYVIRRGWDVGIPGLVIDESNTTTGKRCWGIIHQSSGCSVYPEGFLSPEQAVACVHALANITDWTRTGLDLMDDPLIHAAVAQTWRTFDADVGPGEHWGVVPRDELR